MSGALLIHITYAIGIMLIPKEIGCKNYDLNYQVIVLFWMHVVCFIAKVCALIFMAKGLTYASEALAWLVPFIYTGVIFLT